jgi:tRNA nucleotidyltransferase (CCA-adding enzyme)
MADYIYLLESRLSQAQQNAIKAVREIARTKGLTVFLVGGAVRDLTSGSPVRDLDVAVQICVGGTSPRTPWRCR